jgi:hypothetical protein
METCFYDAWYFIIFHFIRKQQQGTSKPQKLIHQHHPSYVDNTMMMMMPNIHPQQQKLQIQLIILLAGLWMR